MLRSKIEAVGRPSPAPWRPSVRPSRGALCARPSASVQFVRRPPPAPGTVLPVCRSLAFASMTNDRTSCSIRPGFLRATIKSRSWIIKLWQFYSLSFPSKENERERERDHIKEVIPRCQSALSLSSNIFPFPLFM